MRPLLFILALAISLPSQAAVEITNFRSGLACTKTKLTEDGSGWICQPTENVLITDQGVCVFSGTEQPCTWIGFEFDYKGAQNGTKLECVSVTSVPVDEGNPEQLIAKNTDSQPYELELKPESGHFFNPQFFAFTTRPKGKETLTNMGNCKSDGHIVFEYRFNIRFPTVAE
jgi:hypothetical protein